MIKTLFATTIAATFATAAFASDQTYDANEALSPEMIVKIKAVYAADFGTTAPVIVRFEGDTESWSDADMALIKAAFAAGS